MKRLYLGLGGEEQTERYKMIKLVATTEHAKFQINLTNSNHREITNSTIDTIDYVNGIGNGRKLCYIPGCAQSINNAF